MQKKLSDNENEVNINKVLKYQEKELDNIKTIDKDRMEETISNTENLLNELGYSVNNINTSLRVIKDKKTIVVPTWNEMCAEASKDIKEDVDIYDLFTKDELASNEAFIKNLNNEFNETYKLDKSEIAISVMAGLISAVVDILLVGMPHKTANGLEASSLSNYVRDWFEKKFPEAEMEELANSKVSKVPYDAQDNRNTHVHVEGLSSYYHRLLSLGHDPFLGLLFGVSDILNGTMTTIDKKGKIVSQVVEGYSDRKESDIFEAITKQFIHFKSDITTSMGLPAPFMSVFNLFQFGEKVLPEEQTIAEIVQGMYFEGYDFINFCSSSIPTMLTEVIVRMGYSLKRIHDGNSIKESIPFSLDRSKNPKLCTMLFISHSISCAVNAGKIYFTQNPLAINFPEWLTFARYSYKQLKWAIIQKPQLKEAYVNDRLFDELHLIYDEIDNTFNDYKEKYNIVLS